ncbi:MAG: Trk system potassium transporter TrkA [Alphaproteobacteria bacterium]|nr:Trk system potassium transporter TrkA [Alphaproteobacteria bacterium]
MKIIVCGAGSIGQSIVSYLVKGNNDISVIDNNQRRLDELSKEFDVLPVVGEASHPDVLERAGAKEADLILAVTDVDEVNMMVCQIAYTLFSIPRKIARIDSEIFLDPVWGAMYNDHNLPIDLIISPDIEVAENILRILQYPGCSGILPIFDNEGYILNLKLSEKCPLLGTPINHICRKNESLDLAVVNVYRNNQYFIPDAYDEFFAGDEINIFVSKDEVYNTISAFGVEKPSNERIVIFGGNAVAKHVAQKLELNDSIISTKIIEEDLDIARKLAKYLPSTVVIQGELLSDVILEEADIGKADATIAITENDKDNLLASLLSAKRGVSTTISLVNTPSYNNLIFDVGESILVDRRSVTISKLLKELRKAKIKDAYSLSQGNGEIWEISIDEEDVTNGKKIGELNLPRLSRVVVIRRGEENICPDPTITLLSGDTILLYVDSQVIRQTENIFA